MPKQTHTHQYSDGLHVTDSNQGRTDVTAGPFLTGATAKQFHNSA